jgi:hypothetical protein
MADTRKLEHIRAHVLEMVARDNAALERGPTAGARSITTEGAMISGVDLERAAEHFDLITDETDRKHVEGVLGSFTKYQALAMLIDEGAPLMKRHPIAMERIVAAATELDAELEGRGS